MDEVVKSEDGTIIGLIYNQNSEFEAWLREREPKSNRLHGNIHTFLGMHQSLNDAKSAIKAAFNNKKSTNLQ